MPGKQQYAVKVVPLDQIQHKCETPKILRSIFWTDSCLPSDHGVITSNSPPARNIVMVFPDYYIEAYIPKYHNSTEFFFTQIWKTKTLHLRKHSNPFLISTNTPMTINLLNQKHYSVFSIDRFESYSFNPDKYKSENKPKKHKK